MHKAGLTPQDTQRIPPRVVSGLSVPAIVVSRVNSTSSTTIRGLTFLLIAASVLLRLVYLLLNCPIELSPDEAHYWDWSRRLDWSYYSKGPLVAWLIRASCACLGETTFAVRLPAVLCHGLLLLAIRKLAVDTMRSDRFALAVIALGLTLPPLSVSAVLMTTDAPFLACWGWGMVLCRQAIFEGRERSWLLAGAVCALGLLAKYSMVLLPVCVALFLFQSSLHRHPQQRRGFLKMLAMSLLGWVPIVIWNASHDWISLWHFFGQAGASQGPKIGFSMLKPLEFLAGQFGLLVGYWLIVWLVAVWQFRQASPSLRYLWWLSVPVVSICFVASIRAKVQPNWSAPGYLAGFVLCVAWLARQLQAPSIRYRRWVITLCSLGVVAGLAVTVLSHFPFLGRPGFAALAGPARVDASGKVLDSAPIRKFDPTARLSGWQYLAAEVDRVRESARKETGQDPAIATMVWNWPGVLAFYCQGNPVVYCFGSALSDRWSQYDLWRPNCLADAQVFRGRTFVYVGEAIPEADEVFDRMAGPYPVVYRENGVAIGAWQIWVGYGFRGFPVQNLPARY